MEASPYSHKSNRKPCSVSPVNESITEMYVHPSLPTLYQVKDKQIISKKIATNEAMMQL